MALITMENEPIIPVNKLIIPINHVIIIQNEIVLPGNNQITLGNTPFQLGSMAIPLGSMANPLGGTAIPLGSTEFPLGCRPPIPFESTEFRLEYPAFQPESPAIPLESTEFHLGGPEFQLGSPAIPLERTEFHLGGPAFKLENPLIPPEQRPMNFLEVNQIIQYFINTEDFVNMARLHPNAFTRARKMPLSLLIHIMFNQIKKSTQTALNDFYKLLGPDKEPPSQQAFSKARQNLNYLAIKMLTEKLVDSFYEHKYEMWNNYILMAADGSKIQLPTDEILCLEFGTVGRNNTAPTAQASHIYDVLNGIIVDALLAPISNDERSLVIEQLTHLSKKPYFSKVLFLADRGYPSFDLIKHCESINLSYLMRVKKKFNAEIDRLPLGCNHIVTLEQGDEKITLRVAKFRLDKGEVETLITNLFDKHLKKRDFKDLYNKRWGIETQYGSLKNKIEIENFSSRTVNGIYQDYFVGVLHFVIVATTLMDVQPIIDKERENKNNLYRYKANFNNAVGAFKDHFILILLAEEAQTKEQLISRLRKELLRKPIPIRPGRSSPRNPNPRKCKFHPNQKSNC
jgi:hypothetical protein